MLTAMRELSGQFLVNGCKSKVSFNDHCLRWVRASSNQNDASVSGEGESNSLEFNNVIGLKKFSKSGKDGNRIKIYFAKENSSKQTSQLVKLKKLVIEAPATGAGTKPTERKDEPADSEQGKAFSFTWSSGDEGRQETICELFQVLLEQLELRRRLRPKRLLVFINPFGGKGKAVHLYKAHVGRLFELAKIEIKLIVTKYANHARDTLEDLEFNVENFDGIIGIGGDGMFSELMNGLLFRYNREKIFRAYHENNNDDHDEMITASRLEQLSNYRNSLGGVGQQFKTPPISIGIIGAGSTDANAFGIIGTNDVITATLNIILSKQINIDICSIHSIKDRDKLLRFVSTFVGYGYFGDVIRESEKLRWLGPSRYDITGVNNLLKNRTYKGLIRILASTKDGTPMQINDRCHANCKLCCQKDKAIDDEEGDFIEANGEKLKSLDLKLIERGGSFIGVNAAVTACRCPQTRKGFSPSNHLANGCVDLILIRPCTRMQYIQYLLRTGWTKKSAFDLKYVEAFRCRQFEFIAEPASAIGVNIESFVASSTGSSLSETSSTSNGNSLDSKQSNNRNSGESKLSINQQQMVSSWNADGEILREQSIRVKVNNQLLRVFGTGEPQLICEQ